MKEGAAAISISGIDEERFGIKTAKAGDFLWADIPDILGFCRRNRVELLIARCSTGDPGLVQGLEREGFLHMDTLCYYSCSLDKAAVPGDASGVSVRPLRKGEEEEVRAVAAGAFVDYPNHYHADRRLDRGKCNEVYTDWAYRSCVSDKVADMVLVAEDHASIVAFATLQKRDPQAGEGVLFGVAPSAQGRGIYRSLMINGMRWCVEQKLGKMLVSTQISNIGVQKVWCRLGFEPDHSYYTFHKWFEHGGA